MNNLNSVFTDLSIDSKKVFDIILKQGPITKNEILNLTNMKLTTLNRFADPLESLNLIVESGIGDSSGGRKPTLYDVKADCFYIVGIDISRTYAQVVLVNMKMEIVFKERLVMDETSSPQNTVDILSKIILKALSLFNIPLEKILGMGIGVVGPIDREQGNIKNPVNFYSNDWVNVPIISMFEAKFKLPVFIDNGANTAVLAEYIFGAGKGLKNIAYFNCGVGIRTGAITSGIITRSINDGEDAFGHMVIDVDGDLCSCGNYGCIECYSSIISITKKFTSEIKKGRSTNIIKPLNEISYKDITKAAMEGDPLSKEIIAGAAGILGTGLANYINLLNPHMVILSGTLIKNSDMFYRISTEVASKKNFLAGHKTVFFSNGGNFGEDAISIGAAALVVENILNWR